MSELEQLAVRCEQATGPDRDIDYGIGLAMGLHAVAIDDHRLIMAGSRTDKKVPAYTASLDAAMMLVSERWDHMEVYRPDHQTLGWTVYLLSNANIGQQAWAGFAQSHVLALTAAALRSRAKGEEPHHG